MCDKIGDEVREILASGGTLDGFELEVPDIQVPSKIT
jgi:hypothetical protein